MAFSLEKIFTTRTAMPKNGGIIEIEPIAVLKPFVRCFWTCQRGSVDLPLRIIPDCCADIIIDLDNKSAGFVGVAVDSFSSENSNTVFGIRFYAWAVPLFTCEKAAQLFNFVFNPQEIFRDFADFHDMMIRAENTAERIAISEKYLLKIVDERYDNDVMNSLYSIILHNGNTSVRDLSNGIAVSPRTLERKFLHEIGISPKTIIELIRYQLLWQDCIGSNFDMLDGIDKFGYYDQAHMYNDFKRFHGIGLSDARREYFNLSHFYNTFT